MSRSKSGRMVLMITWRVGEWERKEEKRNERGKGTEREKRDRERGCAQTYTVENHVAVVNEVCHIASVQGILLCFAQMGPKVSQQDSELEYAEQKKRGHKKK